MFDACMTNLTCEIIKPKKKKKTSENVTAKAVKKLHNSGVIMSFFATITCVKEGFKGQQLWIVVCA